MLRLASLSIFIAGAIALAACDTAVIAGGGGGGGDTTSSSTTSSGDTTSATTSSTTGTGTGGGDACTQAGGSCVAIVPDACMTGTWGDPSMYGCGQGDGVGCCLPAAKTACEDAGGTCVPVVPDACATGVVGDPAAYSCGGGVGVECCLPLPQCTPGQDQTCNEILSMSSFAGHCNADGTCTCTPPFTKKPSGKCG